MQLHLMWGIMMTKTLMTGMLAWLCCAFVLGAGEAGATLYTLSLNGTVSNAIATSHDGGGIHYDYWALELDGLSSSNAITVAAGDTIRANISLDTSVTIPLPNSFTWFDLILRGPETPPGITRTNINYLDFFQNSAPVASFGPSNTLTAGQITAAITFAPIPITFDAALIDFNITEVNTPTSNFALDSAQIEYVLFSDSSASVPEPGTFILLGAGLAGIALLRKKRQV